jgi:hypothetical protein
VWGTARLLAPHHPLCGGAAHPRVAGMAAKAETRTPLGHGVHCASVGSHALDAFSQRIGLFPRPGAPPEAPHMSRLSPMLPVHTVTSVPGLYRHGAVPPAIGNGMGELYGRAISVARYTAPPEDMSAWNGVFCG